MITSFEERISALLDDELTDFESRRVTDEVLADPALRARCERYLLIGDVMRNEAPTQLDMDFSRRVMQSLEDVPSLGVIAAAVETGPQTSRALWRRPLAGAAIAASVAALALGSVQMLSPAGVSGTPVASVAMKSPGSVASAVPIPSSSGNSSLHNLLSAPAGIATTVSAMLPENSLKPMLQNGLVSDGLVKGYLTTHSEFASRTGVMSRIRVLGLEGQGQ